MAKHLTRLGPLVWGPTGRIPVGRSKFYLDYIATSRIQLIPLGERATAVCNEQLDTGLKRSSQRPPMGRRARRPRPI
jgi:hypothetical protein